MQDMTEDHISAIETAMSAALTHYEETMGKPFKVVPKLLSVEDDAFWAVAEPEDETILISVSTGIVQALTVLWGDAAKDKDLAAGVSMPFDVNPTEMVHLGLTWLMLHELHHYQMGHFAFTGRLCLTEANAPERFGLVERAEDHPSVYDNIEETDWPKVEPCLEMQADHDAMEMLLDAYSADGWDLIRTRTAAISAMMMLIEREGAKREIGGISHPKAATRVFQMLGHVIEMPLIQAKLAQERPELNIDPTIPSDDEQSAFNREVTIPSFFDAVNLARIAEADTIREDLGEAQDFFRDVQIVKFANTELFTALVTTGAKQWSALTAVSVVLESKIS